MKTYYTNVVYSGSTCMCGALKHTARECGHKHTSIDAAEKCLEKLRGYNHKTGTCSADWYHGQTIERVRGSNDTIRWVSRYDADYNYIGDKLTTDHDSCTC